MHDKDWPHRFIEKSGGDLGKSDSEVGRYLQFQYFGKFSLPHERGCVAGQNGIEAAFGKNTTREF